MENFLTRVNHIPYMIHPLLIRKGFWMKISITFLLLSILGLQFLLAHDGYGQGLEDEVVTLDVKSKQLGDVLREIEKQTTYRFAYNASQVDQYRVNLDSGSRSLSKTLELILAEIPLEYKVIKNKFIVLSTPARSVHRAAAPPLMKKELPAPALKIPPLNVSGTVTDQDGEPLIGVNVQVKGTSHGTATDFDGKYELNDVDENAVLVFSYVGFHTQEVTIGGRTTIDVVMQSDAQLLEEVVVVGYGSQMRRDLTGSVAVVDVAELKAQPSASPIDGLQGKAPGVQIISDGAPGGTPQIRISGFSTINNNDPLYIIDGMPYTGKLSWLNASDIESMQVLKDASAASIYGARANNGVVIITTRSGKSGAPKISFDTYYGIQSPNRNRFPEFRNPQQYAEYVYERYRNAGKTPGQSGNTGTNYGTDPNKPVLPEYLVAGSKTGHEVTAADADPAKYNYVMDPSQFYQITKANKEGTNWFEEITQNAPMQNYQLAITGGSENATYALSGGYFRQEGTYKYTNFERYTLRSNSTFKVFNDRVTIGENLQYSFTKGNGFGVNVNTPGSYQGEASPIGWAYRIQTIVPVYDIMGNFAGTRGDKLGNADNPLSILYRAKDNIGNSGQLFGSTFADVKILEALNFRTTFGLRYENWNGYSIGYPNPERSEANFDNNSLSEYQGHGTDWTWTNTLTYKNRFGDAHDLTLLLGTEAFKGSSRSLDGSGRDFFVTGDLNYYYINTAATNSAGSSGGSSALFSLFGRADYALMDNYLFSATLRRDGSSNFGPENQYGLFPAASFAWRLSGEEFMSDANWMDDVKVRVGYGVTGNQSIPSFQYLRRFASSINASSYPISGGELSSGLWTSNYDNAAIRWEQVKSVNVGIDYSLFNQKIDGSLEWFDKRTDGVLYPVPQPTAAVGAGSSPFINSGDIKNTGVEFSINYHHATSLGSSPFQFDVGFFISHYTNDIIQLAPSVYEQPYLTLRGVTTSVMKSGAPLGAFYGYKIEGIFESEEEIANAASYDGARVGGFKFADVSGPGPDGKPDGVIDGHDRTVIGNPHPDFIYSLSLSAAYKNFDVNMFFNGSQGNDLFDLTRQFTDFYAFPGAVSVRTLDAWSPENPDGKLVSPNADAPTIEYQSSSYYVQDGSYFRMKNLQLGYTFPTSQVLNGAISNLRFYISATNLFTITSYSGMDPEVSQYSSTFTGPGVDMGVYPVPRQFLLGLNVVF